MEKKAFLIFLMTIFLLPGSAMALSLGTNITIPDGVGTGSGWYGTQEDDEVEPNCVTGQQWDLEGFYLNGTKLSMVGGYDFVNGQQGEMSGDIFIDVDGGVKIGKDTYDVVTGNGNNPVKNTFGYDYVLDMNFQDKIYDVYALTGDSVLETTYYRQNDESNPWRYLDEGELLYGGVKFVDYYSDSDVEGLAGENHNVVVLDLEFLDLTKGFLVHNTMQCGNDNLMGQTAPVPEPASMLLLGTGLVGFAGLGRKRFFAKR